MLDDEMCGSNRRCTTPRPCNITITSDVPRAWHCVPLGGALSQMIFPRVGYYQRGAGLFHKVLFMGLGFSRSDYRGAGFFHKVIFHGAGIFTE